jgi:N6-adenosine-specific RNA methylase IME4
MAQSNVATVEPGYELALLDRLQTDMLRLKEITDLGEIKEFADRAKAFGDYAKAQRLSENIQNNIAEYCLNAVRQMGIISAGLKRDKGGRPGRETGAHLRQSKSAVLAAAGIDRRRANEAESLAALPDCEFEAIVTNKKQAGDLSKHSVIKEVNKRRKQAERGAEIERLRERAVETPADTYDCVVIDPPWSYGTQYDPTKRKVASPYPEMSIDELKNLDIASNNDCVLFLWTTHKFIWDAKELLEHWGFEYRSMLVWDKETMGTGDFLRLQCEFCLIGLKGKPLLDNPRNIRDIIREHRRGHSRKPEAFYELVERLCPGTKIESFSRSARDGWAAYGNDTERFRSAAKYTRETDTMALLRVTG